jgi:hypothetical protein
MLAKKIFWNSACLLGVALLAASAARADIIPIGSTLTFGGTDAPGSTGTWSDTVSFGSTSVLVDGGALELSETQISTGPSGEWDAFSLSTVSGGPLADDTGADWNIVMDYDLSAPAYFDGGIIQFTVNGTPVSPISDFSACCGPVASTNPVFGGEAYYSPAGSFQAALSAGEQTGWQEIYLDPYSILSEGGIDPSTANGLNFALHFTLQSPAAVPEPRMLPMLLVMFSVAVVGAALRRRQRRANQGSL